METILTNGNLNVTITSKGAELTSLKTSNREYIWEGNPEFWGKHSPVLFPIVGTLKNNEYTFDSKTYSLSRHGFARDREFECICKTAISAEFSLKHDEETVKVYPFRFDFRIIYTLVKNKLRITYKVLNESENELYFSVGAHPAFALPKPFGDYTIQLEKDDLEYHLLENDLVSHKTEILKTDRKKIKLGYELFDRDALIFKDIKSHLLTILENDKPLLTVAYPEFPHLGIWTKRNAPFICIEPWFGYSDTVDSNGDFTTKAGIQKLGPNKTFENSFTIEIV